MRVCAPRRAKVSQAGRMTASGGIQVCIDGRIGLGPVRPLRISPGQRPVVQVGRSISRESIPDSRQPAPSSRGAAGEPGMTVHVGTGRLFN